MSLKNKTVLAWGWVLTPSPEINEEEIDKRVEALEDL